MVFDKKVTSFLNKYLSKITSIYSPDEMWLWGQEHMEVRGNIAILT